MVKIDEIKEEIGWLKIMFGILTAVDMSLLSWFAQNHETISIVYIVLSLVSISFLSMSIILVNKSAYKKIRQLRDL